MLPKCKQDSELDTALLTDAIFSLIFDAILDLKVKEWSNCKFHVGNEFPTLELVIFDFLITKIAQKMKIL